MKIKKNVLLSLILGTMLFVSVTGMVSATCPTGGCDPCSERYRVDTYESDYSTLKDSYIQGETVYAKGWDGPFNLRLLFFYPNGTLAKTCAQSPPSETTCSLDLASNAPTGTWKVELQYYGYSKEWIFWDCETFTVEEIPECELIIDPFEGSYHDGSQAYYDSEPVPINWHLSKVCTPVNQFIIQYQEGGVCDPNGNWHTITTIDSGDAAHPKFPDYYYLWDSPPASGQYCIYIKVTCANQWNLSEIFNVDLAPPEVSLEVGTPKDGECGEEETGDCYVNQDTEITLTCVDDIPDKPWQSGVNYTEYRYQVDGGDWTNWKEISNGGHFSFPEDTNHVLEYRCYDKVGKVDSETKTFIVESDTPELDRTVTGPQEYPEEGCDGCTPYFNKETEVCMHLENFPEHTIPGVAITCDYWYGDVNGTLTEHHGEFTLEDGECFSYEEDSYHSLECTVTDNLGNSYTHPVWFDVVDAKAPVITVNVGDPKYGGELYVSNDTQICVSAEDDTPHPVGFVELNCEYDWKKNSEDSWTDMGELTLDGNGCFNFAEDSYHMLRCTAIDALDNEAQLEREFIVDTLAPTLLKEVGKPNHDCNSPWEVLTGECEEDWDWIVTTLTPIFLSCEDQLPHPSGVDELCYKILWDGGEPSYPCGGRFTDDGYYCIDVEDGEKVPVYFYKECEHTLEFYCVDNLGRTSETDTEIFKVEGTPFPIFLDRKWNLISFPFNLLSNNIEEVFDDASDKIEGVWSYENGEWKVYTPEGPSDLTEVVPGRGYWVKTTEATSVLVGGELMSEGEMVPPSVELDKGWNLIGHYGTMPKQAYCSLFSLVDTQEGFPRWSALWGYNTMMDRFYPLDSLSTTYPGQGYWIEMDVEDEYSPATTCWGLPTL